MIQITVIRQIYDVTYKRIDTIPIWCYLVKKQRNGMVIMRKGFKVFYMSLLK